MAGSWLRPWGDEGSAAEHAIDRLTTPAAAAAAPLPQAAPPQPTDPVLGPALSSAGSGRGPTLDAAATGAPAAGPGQGNGTLAIRQEDAAATSSLGAAPPTLPADRILVQWDPRSTASDRRAALQALGGRLVDTIHTPLMRSLGQGPVEVISLPVGLTREQGIRAYSRRAGVRLAEVDWVVGAQVVSNDPSYTSNSLWGMNSSDSPSAAGPSGTTNSFGSQAEQAWAQDRTGSSKVVVGVIDEGIDYTHPDLYLNIWLNQGEIRSLSFFASLSDTDSDGLITYRDLNNGANGAFVTDVNLNGRIDAGDLLRDSRWADGIDNDGNGYRDDLAGWDFYNNSNDPFRPSDGDAHGTHVGGTIAGIGGNGIGVAGVNWTSQLMSLKFLGPQGGYTSGAINAVNYYANITSREDVDYGGGGQYVGTSNSWGGGGSSSTLQTAIVNGAKVGNLFVAAAGNSNSNNDSTASFPSNYSTTANVGWDAVVAVASITSTGARSSFSSYGATTVDLGAPGSGIVSTVPGGYANYSGTSMATPHVSGALALMAATFPTATPQQLLQALYSGTAATSSLAGLTVTGGRLDVNAALRKLNEALNGGGDPPPPSDAPRTIWGSSASDDLTGAAGGGSGDDEITGVLASGTTAASLGFNQIDVVTGAAGADRFRLADNRGVFYTDGASKASGIGDYLWIKDFNAGVDKLLLRAGSQHLVRNVSINATPFTEIYLGNGDNRFNSSDELIARMEGTSLAAGTGVYILGTPAWTIGV